MLGLVVILSILVFPVSAQGNDTGAAKSEEDFLLQSQRNLDRSLSILNTVATSMGVAVGLLTLVVVIVGGFGIFQIKSWHDLKKDVYEKVKTIENLKIKAEKDVKTIRNVVKNIPQVVSTEKPSNEVLRKLDDFSRHLETLELLGATLKPDDYLKRGNDLYYKKDYEFALKAYDKVIQLKPDFFEAWSNKGATLADLGRHEEALEAANKAVKLNQYYVEPWSNKGVALCKLNRYEEALEAFEKAIELKPDYALALSNKSFTLTKLNRFDDALKASNKAIKLNPDLAFAWFNRACVYGLLGNKENTLSDLKKAIGLDESYKEKAKKDEDFKDLWVDEEFKKLVE